jgi:hypothetical protein
LGREPLALAYPHGQTSPSVSRLARAAGYACALTTRLGLNDAGQDAYELRRIVIASDDDLFSFAARVAGLTSWFTRLREVFARAKGKKAGRREAYDPAVADQLNL